MGSQSKPRSRQIECINASGDAGPPGQAHKSLVVVAAGTGNSKIHYRYERQRAKKRLRRDEARMQAIAGKYSGTLALLVCTHWLHRLQNFENQEWLEVELKAKFEKHFGYRWYLNLRSTLATAESEIWGTLWLPLISPLTSFWHQLLDWNDTPIIVIASIFHSTHNCTEWFLYPVSLVKSHQIDSKMHTNCALGPQVPHTA